MTVNRAASKRSSWIWASHPVSSASRLPRHRSTGQVSFEREKDNAFGLDHIPKASQRKNSILAHVLPAPGPQKSFGRFRKRCRTRAS